MWKSAIAGSLLALATACDPGSATIHEVEKADLGTATGPTPTPAPTPTADMATAGDLNCGGQAFTVQRVPPNVFLVIDRSGSMADPISNGSSTSKWQDMQTAVGQLVTMFGSEMNLGMSQFSSDGDCGAGQIDAALAASNGSHINSLLEQSQPNGNTPTAATLAYIAAHAGLTDPTRQNVVVLATDGEPNCSDTDVTSKITALYNQTPSVKTFVIGVGDGTASDPSLLNTWATAGHTAQTGATQYYQADSSADLTSAFQSIAGGIASCTFSLSSTPPDASQLYVWLGSTQVPADPTNGYSYSGTTITLNGSSCTTLENDSSVKLQVIYGCPTPPPID